MYRVRKCDQPSDADPLHALTRELADFEDELLPTPTGPVSISVDTLRKDGFETSPPLFHAALAEYKPQTPEDDQGDWTPVGYAVWFFNYSTWEGRCFYLEDRKFSTVSELF